MGRRFQPTYLVVVNPRNQFSGDRFRYVETSQAHTLFTQLDLGVRHPHIVKFRLGSYGGTDLSDSNVLHYTQNSPYVALCLAAHMGATRIGVIGVDFTDHHFFAKTGAHALSRQLATIDEQYHRLGEALRARGVEVFNLSRVSRLTAFAKMPVEEFTAPAQPTAPLHEGTALKIVSYATTPVAGVPAILARCINARTPHTARCVWARNDYGNGVSFEGDLQWSQSPAEAEEVLAQADVIIVHNGKVEARHHSLLAGKAIVTMAITICGMWTRPSCSKAFRVLSWGNIRPRFRSSRAGWWSPNPMPLWDQAYQPDVKGQTLTLCYTPSGKHERYPQGHRLYWHSKGYETTMRVLDQLATRFALRLEVIRDRQISHAESLAMKRRANIVIDECVTGSYHRNSLEGLATGCVVVNGVGLLPGVPEVFRRCAANAVTIPFVQGSLDDLHVYPSTLLERGDQALTAVGIENRAWMERYWDFSQQWTDFWMPAVSFALRRVGRSATLTESGTRISSMKTTTS